ncbi:MAG TPA: phosphate signaling complex protein PhoU [Thermoanaerobaculales bacterium]|nr:phosphate signaling complex protein PhoU [Thermoanaerobaculales bacterium]HPA79240.1 phosphate signaling complex protein PhoU [Thermoanaerobaculales bacterium]HQL28714.1 phosphate signaling complex protein PhoU [Thermoanaerobaculales bacterium]HQN96764.1 phosphate signaling complex protein PhoU [Thermoanaerobaculales bacterium]HQP42916.1 phosphate signaling complex protein PhoU [Thermoanaerobaculales bacterium]
MTTHLEAMLQQDLERIRLKVVEMGDLAERAIRASIRSVLERDRQLAFAVIMRDQFIDQAEKELDRLCLQFLVRYQPAASLLRFAYATIKVNLELERVGDYAESIARQALKLAEVDAPLPLDRLQQVVDLAVPMLHDAIQAFVGQDAELARKTIESDEAVDLLRDQLTKDLTSAYKEGRLPFEALNPLVMVARRLERVSDQARNIGMETLYMCTGEIAKHPGSDVFQVLFVDEHNACRSVIAEMIGTALREPGFVFSSAGLIPAPVAEPTVRFMASRGFDVSRFVPRAVTSVANIDHEDVIVLLAPEARRAFPRRPRHTVMLDWPVDDPNAVVGDEATVAAAYDRAYSFLEEQILDLVSAIRDAKEG